MKPISLILYGSKKKLSRNHWPVTDHHQPKYYVRTKIFHGDCDEALIKAKPHQGESVLNTVPLD